MYGLKVKSHTLEFRELCLENPTLYLNPGKMIDQTLIKFLVTFGGTLQLEGL